MSSSLVLAALLIANNSVTSAAIVKDWWATSLVTLPPARALYKLMSAKISLDTQSFGISTEHVIENGNNCSGRDCRTSDKISDFRGERSSIFSSPPPILLKAAV